jgi:hypothetical protein
MSPKPISVLLERYDEPQAATPRLALHVIRDRKLKQVRPNKVNLPQTNVSQRSFLAAGTHASHTDSRVAVPRHQCHTTQHQQDDRELSQACLRRWAFCRLWPWTSPRPDLLMQKATPAPRFVQEKSIVRYWESQPPVASDKPLPHHPDNPPLTPIPNPVTCCNTLFRHILPQLYLVAHPAPR